MINQSLFRMLIQLIASLLWLLGATSAFAQNPKLAIHGYPPELPREIAGNAWFIFLDGVIDHQAPKRFEEYITTHNVPALSAVYLNSPGGDLLAGLELGRLIRKHSFTTNIARKSARSGKRYDVDPGGCFSACAYTYLGGQFRYFTKGSTYGVHRFAPSGTNTISIDTAQIASAVIVEYIRFMGIDPVLFESAAIASPEQMNVLDRTTLEKLGVVNNGRTRPKWTIESVAGRIYFKGERVTDESGVNKFMIICDHGRPALYAIFNALNRDRELMSMPASSLLVNETSLPIRLESRSIRNGLFNGFYQLSPHALRAIQNAKTVGVAMRFTYEAPIFLGFQGMPIEAGREKLKGFLNSCRRR